MLISHSCAFYAKYACAKDVTSTLRGSEITSASGIPSVSIALWVRVNIVSVISIVSVSSIASANSIASTSSIAS